MSQKRVILINGRDLSKPAGGTRTYLENLLSALDKQLQQDHDLTIYVLKHRTTPHVWKQIKSINTQTHNSLVFDLWTMAIAAIKLRAQVVIGTKCICPPLFQVKRISFFYDLGHFYPESYYTYLEKAKMIFLFWISRLYTNIFIAISKNTKDDLANFLHVQSQKISVLYPGANHLKEVASSEIKLPKKYLLFTGSNSKRKNLLRLIQAVERSNVSLPLVLTGYNYSNKTNRQGLISSKKTSFIQLDRVSAKQLKYLYEHAYVFLYPSLFEGFGIPILEAQSLGVPVITGNTSSMPEAAGKGAVLVNPKSVSEIKSAIELVSSNSQLRDELINQGKKNADKYSWEKTAEKLIIICKQN